MTSFAELLVDLSRALANESCEADDGVVVRVSGLQIDVPIETSWDGTELRASLPRTRLATGFRMPVCRLRARWEEVPE